MADSLSTDAETSETESATISDESVPVPTNENVLNLLLAREGDAVALDEDGDEDAPVIEEIVHERNTREKRVRLSDGTIVARGEGESAVKRVGLESDNEPEDVRIGQFRVTDRLLMLRPEAWDAREDDVPVERHRHVRVDEAARPAIVQLVGWLAATWDLDERTGNGAWRKSRDDVLTAAYRLSQGDPDPRAEGTFTIETIVRNIILDGVDHAEDEPDAPVDEEILEAIAAQVETPGLVDWSESVPTPTDADHDG